MPSISEVVDLKDVLALPKEVLASFKPVNMRAKGYPFWTKMGDTQAFLALFLDNLATQLSLIGIAMFGFGSPSFSAEFVYSHFMGGVGISLLFGNAYYALQASKLAVKTGDMTVCAQPYGINTPGAIAKSFSILLPAYFGGLGMGLTPDGAMERAWSIACCANFIGGLAEFLGSFFLAPLLYYHVPFCAVLVPIAGVGVTWLGYGQITATLGNNYANNPLPAFLPMLLIWISFYGNPRLFGPIPTTVVSSIVGIILFVICNPEVYGENIEKGAKLAGKGGLAVPDFGYFSEIGEHAGLVIGLACTSFIGTFCCVISARVGGDTFSPSESMMIDGLGTMLGACFGSPYGTTVYIGHPTYKKFGGTRGYSLVNGILFFIMGMAGLHPLVDGILPHEIILGVIICIGFTIAGQCIEETPKRWYPAVLLGLAITFSDIMGVNGVSGNTPIWQNGYIFVSMLYTFLFCMLADRWFWSAAWILIIMALCTSFGLIHSRQLELDYKDGHLKHGLTDPSNPLTWKIIVTYLVSAVFMFGLYAVQVVKKDWLPKETEDYRAKQYEFMKSTEPGVKTETSSV